MELVYRAKKPETIARFIHENNIPLQLIVKEEKHYQIFVNKVHKKRSDTVKKGEKIHFLIVDEGLDKRIKPEPMELNVVFEDEYLLVVNKPSNMQMMISKSHMTGTLANGVCQYFVEKGINSKIHFVTKLDKEASGLIVIAKHKFIKYLLSNKTDNAVQYQFKAIVEGILDLKENEIPLPIQRLEGSVVREVSESGEECLTHYKVTKEFDNYSLLKVTVKNKKAHQIRVHFSFFGFPIVGDELYNKSKHGVSEILLFCDRVKFIHPITDKEMDLELELPQSFQQFISGVKR